MVTQHIGLTDEVLADQVAATAEEALAEHMVAAQVQELQATAVLVVAAVMEQLELFGDQVNPIQTTQHRNRYGNRNTYTNT